MSLLCQNLDTAQVVALWVAWLAGMVMLAALLAAAFPEPFSRDNDGAWFLCVTAFEYGVVFAGIREEVFSKLRKNGWPVWRVRGVTIGPCLPRWLARRIPKFKEARQ